MTARYDRNRRAGVRDRIIKPHGTARQNDELAKQAEDWFADRYGLPHDDSRKPTNHEFKVGVCKIDVKWTPYETGRLVHRMGSRTRCDVYVLVIGQPGSFHSPGWAWGKDLHLSVIDLGYGRTYGLEQADLHPNTDLLMATLGLRVR